MRKIARNTEGRQSARLHLWSRMTPPQRWTSLCRLYGAKWHQVQSEKAELERARRAAA